MAQVDEKPTRIEIIWDRDHGTWNEGWYVRRRYADGHDEDENLGETGYGSDATDEDLIDHVLDLDDAGVPTAIIR